MTRRAVVRLLLLAPILSFLAACSDDGGVRASETQFEDAYLEPLDSAGLTFSVAQTCHYDRRTADEDWHLEINVVVDADPEVVADALDGAIDVIDRDRDPMVLQHHGGEPGRGWDGVLRTDGERTILGVVKNNVTVDGDRPPVGWLPVCDQNG